MGKNWSVLIFTPFATMSPSEWIFQAAWHLVRGLYTRADGGVSSCKQMHWVASTSDELLNEKIVLEKYIKHLFLNIWPLFLFFLYFWEAFPTKSAFFNIVNLVCKVFYNVFKKRVSVRTKNERKRRKSVETMSNVPLNRNKSSLQEFYCVNFRLISNTLMSILCQ